MIAARRLLVAVLVLSLAACAGKRELSDPVNDPWEPVNRGVFAFNTALDNVVFKPVARGYLAVTPEPVQDGFRNFFDNLRMPLTILNLALQGKFRETGQGLKRFTVNTTIGLFGFLDPASYHDIPRYDEDFGQTFAAWGWEHSHFVMLPFLGPSTVRDTTGAGTRWVAGTTNGWVDPVSWAIDNGRYEPVVLDAVVRRADLLPTTDRFEDAYDPYLLMRDAFLQNREFMIYDGDPPSPDYDAYLEELDAE